MKRNWYAAIILLALCVLLFRAANRALRSTQVLGLLVRRNILDQLNQTLAVLPPCAEADSLADLEMETQRACTQIEQVRQSFFSGF